MVVIRLVYIVSTWRLIIFLITAKTGTPTNIPTNPKNFPKRIIAKITQNGDNPVEFPRILGPRILPSNCWSINTMSAYHKAWTGLINKSNTKPIPPPTNGPKYGMIFVIPTIRLRSSAYG